MKTRNVEIGVYNKNGIMIDKKLFLSINGIFKGQFKIDSTYAHGQYFLKAETNYMKNFEEDYAHIQAFEVIGEEEVAKIKDLTHYDFQILPEGGQIVEECVNILGIKITNYKGASIKYKAQLI